MNERPETTDLAQIGLTPEGQMHLDAVMKTGWFETAQDAYRLAVAVALANGVAATVDQVRGAETRYNFVGGVDRDGKMRALMATLKREDAQLPARYAERLAHAGLAILSEKLSNEDALLSEALGYREEEVGSST